MSLFKIFDTANSAITANYTRLGTIASNLASQHAVSSTEKDAYREKQVIFTTIMDKELGGRDTGGVTATKVVESDAPIEKRYEPNHPLADGKGFIYLSNVSPIRAMADMRSSENAIHSNIQVINTIKSLMVQTLRMGN